MNHAAPSERLHALDNLRALMMWLGIVLHAGAIYLAGEGALPWRDGQRTPVADGVVAFIHVFRMPLFFILAGFFLARLLHRRGPVATARHRVLRLGLPFAVFWPPLFALTGVLALLFLHRMARGTWGVDFTLMQAHPEYPVGPSTMHLWFLWMLLWFSLLACACARWLSPAAWQGAARGLQRLGVSMGSPSLLALPLVVAGWEYPHGLLRTYGSFVPPWNEWVHNGLFFVFGLALQDRHQALFAHYRRRWIGHAALGLATFLAAGALIEGHAPHGWGAYAYNMSSWWCSFALIGLALNVLNQRHRVLAYLADSSYWVYLAHMPLTIGFGALLYGLPWPALAKLALNIGATTLVCLGSYQLFVRFTGVSPLLNGRRHSRPANASSHPAAAAGAGPRRPRPAIPPGR